MSASRFRIDLFALALAALALLSYGFFRDRNGAALVMCALCFAGLITARAIGFSNRALVPLTLGLVVILWIVWISPPTSSRSVSAAAHVGGGLLIGWALSEYLRTRVSWPLWGAVALFAVGAVTVLWEIGEFIGDSVLDTGLQASKRDSAIDIICGSLGGAAAVFLAWLVAPVRRQADAGT